jgi:hypothetical protein
MVRALNDKHFKMRRAYYARKQAEEREAARRERVNWRHFDQRASRRVDGFGFDVQPNGDYYRETERDYD